MDDILITFGSELKTLPNGRIGGHLVRFTDATKKDRAGDYFSKDTDFGFSPGETKKSPVWFNHRLPLETREGKYVVIKTKIGEAELSIDEEGVLIDAILFNREKHEQWIAQAGEKKWLGWSSGSAAHLVDREDDGHIKAWPLGLDASLTPIPCDAENCAIPIKNYPAVKFQPVEIEIEDEPAPFKGTLATKLNQHIDDLVDDGHSKDQIIHTMAAEAGLELGQVKAFLEGKGSRPTDANLKAFCRALKIDYKTVSEIAQNDYRQSIKGMFETALSSKSYTRGDVEAVYLKVISRLAAAAHNNNLAGVQFDLKAKLDEAAEEFTRWAKSHAFIQVQAHIESGSDEPFHLKSVLTDLTATEGLDLDDHSQLSVSAGRGLVKRFRGMHETRLKSGRVLSEKNRGRVEKFRAALRELDADMEALLNESMPMAPEEEKSAAHSNFLRLQWRAKQLGVVHG